MNYLEGIVLGLHLVSAHVPAHEDQNNFNPGVFVRLENGATAGIYYNTLRKTTVYGGWTTPEFYRVSATLGIATGYQREEKPIPCEQTDLPKGTTNCRYTTPGVKQYLTPLIAPSVRLPEIGGITPRVSFVPGLAGRSNVFHLSIERKW